MSDKPTAQSSHNLPTVQERIDGLAEQFKLVKESVTPKNIERVAGQTGYSTKTIGRYIDGKVALLHRGEMIYKALLKEVGRSVATA